MDVVVKFLEDYSVYLVFAVAVIDALFGLAPKVPFNSSLEGALKGVKSVLSFALGLVPKKEEKKEE